MSSRIEREKRTVELMVHIYCCGVHTALNPSDLCDSCRQLLDYSKARLEHCPFGESKGSCKRCSKHCYKISMRGQIQAVMRYSGPRILTRAPLVAIGHLLGV